MNVGEPRATPQGQPLDGNYTSSYCTLSFNEKWVSSDTLSLPEAIGSILDKLTPHTDLLQEITESGGSLEFFIGLAVDANCGLTLEPELMRRLVDLHIEVGFDMYPPDKN